LKKEGVFQIVHVRTYLQAIRALPGLVSVLFFVEEDEE